MSPSIAEAAISNCTFKSSPAPALFCTGKHCLQFAFTTASPCLAAGCSKSPGFLQASVREVKRLDAISRSPVYSSIGEELAGLATIRAYRAEDRLIRRNGDLIDRSVIFSLANQSMNRFLFAIKPFSPLGICRISPCPSSLAAAIWQKRA